MSRSVGPRAAQTLSTGVGVGPTAVSLANADGNEEIVVVGHDIDKREGPGLSDGACEDADDAEQTETQDDCEDDEEEAEDGAGIVRRQSLQMCS